MTQPVLTSKALVVLEEKIKESRPLIHYITHPIVMNDCANVILGLGARPIMAEHPLEVEEITSSAKALGINLGNISDSRMLAMEHSVKRAYEKKIPWCIDLVGVGCSSLRKNFAKKLIANGKPQVIKGNMSEIKAILGAKSHSCGIDVGECDVVGGDEIEIAAKMLQSLAEHTDAVIVATGKIDLISDAHVTYAVYNGCEMLGRLTGTGCMLTGMITTFLAEGRPLESSLLATLMMGIAGERANGAKGNGSFKIQLLDEIYSMTMPSLLEEMSYKEIREEV